MNLCVEQQADLDKAGKVKSCFAKNCEHDIRSLSGGSFGNPDKH